MDAQTFVWRCTSQKPILKVNRREFSQLQFLWHSMSHRVSRSFSLIDLLSLYTITIQNAMPKFRCSVRWSECAATTRLWSMYRMLWRPGNFHEANEPQTLEIINAATVPGLLCFGSATSQQACGYNERYFNRVFVATRNRMTLVGATKGTGSRPSAFSR